MAENCANYVSMLHARRADDEAGRAIRAQRRAAVVASNNEQYKRRANAIRRKSMEQKMQMTSRKEQNLFDELSALSKWRHVMYENILHREQQHADANKLHEDLRTGYLDMLHKREKETFDEACRDDQLRFDAVTKAATEEGKQRVLQTCREVLTDVLSSVDKHIDFCSQYQLQGTQGLALPRSLTRDWIGKAAFPQSDALAMEAVVQRHVNLTLYEDSPNPIINISFSSLIQKMLSMQFPKPPPFKPKNPSPLPVVVVAGPKLSGKSSVAKSVAESLGMAYLSDTDVIQLALSEFERELHAEDFNGEGGTELLDLGREAQETLLTGSPISPNLMARLVLYQLKNLPEGANGLVLDGCPSSVEGYETFEQVLSGYDKGRLLTIPEELLAPLVEGVSGDAPVLDVLKPTEVPAAADPAPVKKDNKPPAKGAKGKGKEEHEEPLPPVDLPFVEPIPPLTEEEEEALAAARNDADVASIHAVVHIHCDAKDSFARFAGLRVDTETGVVYHIERDPPPADRLPFLVPKDRTETSTAKLHEAVQKHSYDWKEITAWLHRYEGLVHELDGSGSMPVLIDEAVEIARNAADVAAIMYQRHTLAEEVVQRQAEMEKIFEERTAQREVARKQLATIYLERGAELPAELVEPPKPLNDSIVLPVPAAVPPVLLGELHSFTKYYSDTVVSCHKEMVTLVQGLYQYSSTCRNYVESYWKQTDVKQSMLDVFLDDFNQMQPALRRDVQGKEELHLRAEQLTESLFTNVEKRREECAQLIEALHHRTTFSDSWIDAVRTVGLMLLQCEVERFFTVRNLSLLYFSAVRNEPCHIEEELVDLVPVLKQVMSQEAPVAVDPKAAKDKKAPPPKKGGKGADEPVERVSEDIFTPGLTKAVGLMQTALDKLIAPAAHAAPTNAKNAKDAKKNAAAADAAAEVQGPTPQSQTVPLLQAELDTAKQRVEAIAEFIKSVVGHCATRGDEVKGNLLDQLRRKQCAQSSCVNSAAFEIRCAIEEERPVLHYMHLGTDTFAVDTNRALATMTGAASATLSEVPFVSLAAPPVNDVQLLSQLTLTRAKELLAQFQILAPHYAIHESDFVTVVQPSDYTPLSSATTLSPVEIFRRFDVNDVKLIDWRDFFTHLLFWCEPSTNNSESFGGNGGEGSQGESFGIDGPSLAQIFDMHADLGSEPLSREEFIDTPFFFEGNMSEERLNGYLDILWSVFQQQDQVLPDTLLAFLCPDPQPLRGVQKAFAVAATAGDENCLVTMEALDAVLHISATCPRRLQMPDPHCTENLEGLFQGNETISFHSACKTHMGRIIFNHATPLLRKSFL